MFCSQFSQAATAHWCEGRRRPHIAARGRTAAFNQTLVKINCQRSKNILSTEKSLQRQSLFYFLMHQILIKLPPQWHHRRLSLQHQLSSCICSSSSSEAFKGRWRQLLPSFVTAKWKPINNAILILTKMLFIGAWQDGWARYLYWNLKTQLLLCKCMITWTVTVAYVLENMWFYSIFLR